MVDGKYTETKGLYTFGVISGVELKKFDRVVGKTVHIDPVLQYDDDPVKRDYSYRVHAAAQGQSGGEGDSLVMPHAHSQDRFSEGELQHQLVFGVSGLSSIIPDQH